MQNKIPGLTLADNTSFKPAFHHFSVKMWLEDIQNSEGLFLCKTCNIQLPLTLNLMAYLYLKKSIRFMS